MNSFQVTFLPLGQMPDAKNDNVDVIITLESGRKYIASFFTLANVKSLFEKNKLTGECANGAYLWATDMILVEELTEETTRAAIADLLTTGGISKACTEIDLNE